MRSSIFEPANPLIEGGWFNESANLGRGEYSRDLPMFGTITEANDDVATFEAQMEEIVESIQEAESVDIRKNPRMWIKDRAALDTYKQRLLDPIAEAFADVDGDDSHLRAISETVSQLWDTKANMMSLMEGTSGEELPSFLPIASLEFPVLVKQFYSSVMKDIIDIEAVNKPNIRKHVRTQYIIDNLTGEEYEYPKCFFDGTWQRISDATRGHVIREDVVPLTNDRLVDYDIVTNLTDGIPGQDKLSLNFKIIGIDIGTGPILIPGNGITFDMSNRGALYNGELDFTAPDGTEVHDLISGRVDYRKNTITLSAAYGQVKGVVFSGRLSNENNVRTGSVREERRALDFKIEDGPRWHMSFTIEELEDMNALLDMNYYNRMVNEITKVQEMQETLLTMQYIYEEFDRFIGLDTDTYNLEPTMKQFKVSLQPPAGFAGDPFKYRAHAVQNAIKGLIYQMLDLTKLEDLSFVVCGNPLATQVLTEFTQWKYTPGTAIGGIKVNHSYGFITDMGATVRIVASNMYDAYTIDVDEDTGKRELVLHILAYPTTNDRITRKHLRYTSHLMKTPVDSAYVSPNLPAGAYNYVTATSRYTNISVQDIQARLIMTESESLGYINPPALRPPVTGAPWPPVEDLDPNKGAGTDDQPVGP
ncbi:MAG: hypothetical protein HDQ88_06140 [Clostridia bacterium]|nr:hypothetical protein [Clostridia bacterium]